jgi:hypothetical protein
MIRHSIIAVLALSSMGTFAARAQDSTSTLEKASLPAKISGHVYRADTGQPLAEAIVTLDDAMTGDVQSKRTSANGEYQFAEVAPGNYYMAAYRTGFVGRYYGEDEPRKTGQPCYPGCLSISSGQKMEAVDLRLPADPPITTMADGSLAAAYPDADKRDLQFASARFSPDGKFLAVIITGPMTGDPEQVWLYDMTSQHFVPVVMDTPLKGAELPEFGINDVAWSSDDTLYVYGEKERSGGGPYFLARTATGTTTELAEFPDPIVALLQRQEASTVRGYGNREDRNNQFVVTVRSPEGHGSMQLTARTANGGETQVIADGSWELGSFLFDPVRSIVLYPKSVGFGTGSIVMFDLKSRRLREIALPVRVEALLDETQDETGRLVAYVADGPCEPDASFEVAESQRLVPTNATLRRSDASSRHVCFVKLP